MLVRIIPIGNVSERLLNIICNELHEVLSVRYRLLPKIEIMHDAFNVFRKQYDAEKIMLTLSQLGSAKFIEKSIPTLAVTEEDIYYNGLNFVFGLEDPKGCCIISTARLKPEFYNQKPNFYLLSERAAKEAIHEIGHYLGLDHCKHVFCVMCFSPSVNDVDAKQKFFCNNCKIKLTMKGINID